jgi:hypothetical protein
MPQFELDSDGTVNGLEFDDLSPFLQGYIEAMFFTNQSCIPMTEWHTEESQERVREGEADGDLPNDAGFSDLHPDTLNAMHGDCSDFQNHNRRWLSIAYTLEPGRSGYRYAKEHLDKRRAGQLFWYARNGHGVGWTDDGDAECLKLLQSASRAFGERNVWFSETEDETSPTGYGWVYLD